MEMESKILKDTLINAWQAVVEQYKESPDESTRIAMNNLGKIIHEVDHRLFEIQNQEKNKQRAIELAEWIEWLKEA